jgi:hypothetical protein
MNGSHCATSENKQSLLSRSLVSQGDLTITLERSFTKQLLLSAAKTFMWHNCKLDKSILRSMILDNHMYNHPCNLLQSVYELYCLNRFHIQDVPIPSQCKRQWSVPQDLLVMVQLHCFLVPAESHIQRQHLANHTLCYCQKYIRAH